MTTMTKIPSMRGVNSKIAEPQATTANLSLAEKRALLEVFDERYSSRSIRSRRA